MKILIIGVGGTGGAVGGYLANDGNDVTLIARGTHLEAIKENGLMLKSKKIGDKLIKSVKVYTMDEYVSKNESPDIVFVCVMYYSLDETIDFMKKISGENTVIIPILNIYGTGSRIQEKLPNITVLDGCIYIVSWKSNDGEITHNNDTIKVVYGYRKNQEEKEKEKLLKLEKALADSQIEVVFSDNIERDALAKLALVSPMGSAGLYFGGPVKKFSTDPENMKFFLGLVQEIVDIGHSMGIEFQEDLLARASAALERLDPESTTSMQRDIAKGGNSEIEGLVYEVVRLGKEYNVPVPNYEKVANLAKEKGLK